MASEGYTILEGGGVVQERAEGGMASDIAFSGARCLLDLVWESPWHGEAWAAGVL